MPSLSIKFVRNGYCLIITDIITKRTRRTLKSRMIFLTTLCIKGFILFTQNAIQNKIASQSWFAYITVIVFRLTRTDHKPTKLDKKEDDFHPPFALDEWERVTCFAYWMLQGSIHSVITTIPHHRVMTPQLNGAIICNRGNVFSIWKEG